MSALDNAGGAITDDGKITGNSATDIFTAIGATWVRSITLTENTGAATPTATLEKYDGSTSYYMRRAVAMTAGTMLLLNEPFLLPLGWKIRVTSGDAAGKIDWSITYDGPSAAKLRG